MNTKYIFLDIDGTLVDYDAKIPDSAILALKKAQKNGHKIIIASGRPLTKFYPQLLSSLKFDGLIASGGACVIYQNKLIFKSTIEGDALLSAIDYFEKKDIKFILQASDNTYALSDFVDVVIPNMRSVGYSEDLIQSAYSDVVITDDPRKVSNVEKFSFFLSPLSPKEISKDLHGRFYVVDYSVGNIKQELFFGEMTLSSVTKATAIEKLMNFANAPISDSIAIGDSGNDLEMIEFAGIGVAMGNSTEQIKNAADFITTDVDKNGIYNAFVKLGLI